MNLYDDLPIPFEIGKKHAAIVISAKEEQSENGKNIISHQLLGGEGETFIKNFYIDTPGGRSFYGRFLVSCGILPEELKNWDDPSNVCGKCVTISFKEDNYTPKVINEHGELVDGESITRVDIKSMEKCTDLEAINWLEELYHSRRKDDLAERSPF
jgi:hypothetical protein